MLTALLAIIVMKMLMMSVTLRRALQKRLMLYTVLCIEKILEKTRIGNEETRLATNSFQTPNGLRLETSCDFPAIKFF